MNTIIELIEATGFAEIEWRMVVMWGIVAGLIYLAVVKNFEPLLLVPISMGALLANLPIHDIILRPPTYDPITRELIESGGLFHYFQLGVSLEIFPPLIFLGVGALTDFGPLIANPRMLLLGAAAQFGIFATFFAAFGSGIFTMEEAAAIAIIGGADGPTSIFVANKLAPELLGAIAVAAYSYMALVPVIQPPIMRLLTSQKERKIRMQSLRKVSKAEKMIFAVVVMTVCILIVPTAAPLISMLFIGNFLRENGATARLVNAAQNEIINIVTIFLGLSVGLKMAYDKFLDPRTMGILALGVVAFVIATASGVLMAKLMNKFSKQQINPLIGSAGVSAVPMAARVSHVEGQKADPGNFLLYHAMGPNVAGVIGSALAAGYFISALT